MACAWKGVPASSNETMPERGGGSPQGRVQHSKNGKQDQGPGQECPEQGFAGGRGDGFERVFHNFFPIHTMILIFHAVQVLQIGAHLFSGFGYLGHFHMFETQEVQQGVAHFRIQNGITAAPLVLGQNPHPIDRDAFCAFHVQQQICKRERMQAAFGALQRSRRHPGKRTENQPRHRRAR